MFAISTVTQVRAQGIPGLDLPGMMGAATDRLNLQAPAVPPVADPVAQMVQTESAMLTAMMGLLLNLMGNQGVSKAGQSTSTQAASPVSQTAPVNATGQTSSASGGGGSEAVKLGQRFVGRNAADIKGSLSHFTAAGGQTNNCADFVSSLLESTGGLKGHFVGVTALEGALKKQGYHQVPASQSKAGDVWISHSRSHTEMVAEAGGKKTIGSNNDRPGHQVISERAKDPGSGVYYSRG